MDTEGDELQRIRLKKMHEFMRNKSAKTPLVHPLNKPLVITDAIFTETVRKYPLVVVDCWAPWCGPCRMMTPIVDELAKEYAGRVVFGKLNVDENPKTSMKYGIMSIPTLLIFRGDTLVDRVIGAIPRQMLEPRITKYLK